MKILRNNVHTYKTTVEPKKAKTSRSSKKEIKIIRRWEINQNESS
jgi:hypothetical protein